MSTTPDPSDNEPQIGAVTIVPFERVRAQIGCAEEAGILMEDRRNVVRVFFPNTDRTFWLDRDKVASIPLGRLPVHPLVETLHRIATRVDAVLIEEQERGDAANAYNVYTPAVTLPDLQYVHDLLGEQLVELTIAAGSVRRVKLVLRWD